MGLLQGGILFKNAGQRSDYLNQGQPVAHHNRLMGFATLKESRRVRVCTIMLQLRNC